MASFLRNVLRSSTNTPITTGGDGHMMMRSLSAAWAKTLGSINKTSNSIMIRGRSNLALRGYSSAAESMPAAAYPPTQYNTGLITSTLKNIAGPTNSNPLPPNYAVDDMFQSQVATKVTTLKNGMRVASQKLNSKGAATIGVWIDAGTRFEDQSINGAAHFLEHLIFKGTEKRSQRSLEKEVEDLGAHLNAYTSREQTVFYAKALTKDVGQITELLANILTGSKLQEDAIARERGVILREMQEVENIPEEVLFDYLHGTAYQGTPLGKTILGPVENIQSMTKADLEKYVKTHYQPHRMVLAAAGDIEHDKLVELANKYFGAMKITDKAEATALDYCTREPAYFLGSDVRVRNDDMPLAHFAIAWESCGWAHPDAVTFMVLQSMLGSWDRSSTLGDVSSTRLARNLSAVPNAKSYMTFNTTYTDTGLFGVYCIGEPPELDDIVHEVMLECVRQVFKPDPVELERAKKCLKVGMLAQLDGSTNVAEDIGRQLLVYGRRIPIAEMFARIDAVDIDAVKRVCAKYIYDRDVAMASMGPIASLPDYNWVRRRTYWSSY